MPRTNTEVRNALMSTVSKLYGGLFPAHDILLRERVQRKLGSRFLSVERDNDSEVDPVIRRNLEDYYEEANGINLIEFSRSPRFFPERSDLYYTLEEVTEIARKSPYVTLKEFFEYVQTRPDRDRFGQRQFYGTMIEYQERGGTDYFLGMEKVSKMKQKLFDCLDLIVENCTKKGYCIDYYRGEISKKIKEYSPECKEFKKSLYKGVKGYIGISFKHIQSDYQLKRGMIKDKLPTYASSEKFLEYCKKFKVQSVKDVPRFEGNLRKKSFYLKYGIPHRHAVQEVYSSKVLDEAFPEREKFRITEEETISIWERIKKGESISDLAEERGVSSSHITKFLQKYNLHNVGYTSKSQKIEVDIEKLKSLLIEGKSYPEIGKELSISPVIISARVKEHDLKKFIPTFEDPIEEIKILLERGESMSSIGRILGINNQLVGSIMKRNGIKFVKVAERKKEKAPVSEIIRLANLGFSCWKIRDELKINHRMVSQILKENGFTVNRGPKIKKL